MSSHFYPEIVTATEATVSLIYTESQIHRLLNQCSLNQKLNDHSLLAILRRKDGIGAPFGTVEKLNT